ncbi:MAG: hypothetical protein J6B28_08900, partial [Eubacterium sp.]|nr:hypothetical protein [Eubacterium sp.]
QQQQLRQHLNAVVAWENAGGQLEEVREANVTRIIQRESERNKEIRKAMQQQMAEAQAERVAAGQAYQVPVKRSFGKKVKRWWNNTWHCDEIRSRNSKADYTSHRMMQQLQERHLRDSNAYNSQPLDLRALREANNVDDRVLRAFMIGHLTNEQNEPLNEYEARVKRADANFFADYVSADLQRRIPHLERITNELLEYKWSESMLTPDYLEEEAGVMWKKMTRMTYFQNMMNDPVNKPYFDGLPELKRRMIQERIINRYAVIGETMNIVCANKGISMDHATYMEEGDGQELMIQLLPMIKEQFRNTMSTTERNVRDAINEHVQRRIEEEKTDLRNAADGDKAMDAEKASLPDLSLNAGYAIEELLKYRKMIEAHPTEYQQHGELVDRTYKLFYQTLDAMSRYTLETMASQALLDENNAFQKTYMQKLMFREANKYQQRFVDQAEIIRHRSAGYADILNHLLRGKELNSEAKKLMRRIENGEE